MIKPYPYRMNPTKEYRGITLVVSHPSRFDNQKQLLSGTAGKFVKSCLGNKFSLDHTEVRILGDTGIIRSGTKVIVALGEKAHNFYIKTSDTDYLLQEARGTPKVCKYITGMREITGIIRSDTTDIICTSTFAYQDCFDQVDYEARFNPYASHEASNKDEVGDEKRRHGKTQRKNYRFWFKSDMLRARKWATRGLLPEVKTQFHLVPTLELVEQVLRQNEGRDLFLDIETMPPTLEMSCFGFGFDTKNVYVVPLVNFRYEGVYSPTALNRILRALVFAMSRNQTVAHNGKSFDYLVLARKYHLPLGRKLYDTMLAHHRCFPFIERSLGHCGSYWTEETFHKDEGIFNPHNTKQQEQLWMYCAKDVRLMMLIKEGIDTYASIRPGVKASIEQVSKSIRPYIIVELTGIKVDEERMLKLKKDIDVRLNFYLRMLKELVGYDINPGSPPQLAKYFHDELCYPIVMKSKKTGLASLAKDSMYKLKLAHDKNAVIDVCLAYRKYAKIAGELKFEPMNWDEL